MRQPKPKKLDPEFISLDSDGIDMEEDMKKAVEDVNFEEDTSISINVEKPKEERKGTEMFLKSEAIAQTPAKKHLHLTGDKVNALPIRGMSKRGRHYSSTREFKVKYEPKSIVEIKNLNSQSEFLKNDKVEAKLSKQIVSEAPDKVKQHRPESEDYLIHKNPCESNVSHSFNLRTLHKVKAKTDGCKKVQQTIKAGILDKNKPKKKLNENIISKEKPNDDKSKKKNLLFDETLLRQVKGNSTMKGRSQPRQKEGVKVEKELLKKEMASRKKMEFEMPTLRHRSLLKENVAKKKPPLEKVQEKVTGQTPLQLGKVTGSISVSKSYKSHSKVIGSLSKVSHQTLVKGKPTKSRKKQEISYKQLAYTAIVEESHHEAEIDESVRRSVRNRKPSFKGIVHVVLGTCT